MLDVTDTDLTMRVDEWLADFENALSGADFEGLASLFHADSFWRDVLAFTWQITTVRGVRNIVAAMMSRAARVRASGLRTNRERTPPASPRGAAAAHSPTRATV